MNGRLEKFQRLYKGPNSDIIGQTCNKSENQSGGGDGYLGPYQVYPAQFGHQTETNGNNGKLAGSNVEITGYEPASNQLVIETPDETTRQYLINQNISPSWYFDLSQPPIAGRPVYMARHKEGEIPNMLTKNTVNLPNRDAGCHQPNWSPYCV